MKYIPFVLKWFALTGSLPLVRGSSKRASSVWESRVVSPLPSSSAQELRSGGDNRSLFNLKKLYYGWRKCRNGAFLGVRSGGCAMRFQFPVSEFEFLPVGAVTASCKVVWALDRCHVKQFPKEGLTRLLTIFSCNRTIYRDPLTFSIFGKDWKKK